MKYPSDEFDEALSAVCDGTIAEEQSRALAALLRENMAARDAYIFAVELHARLASDNALFFTPASEEAVGEALSAEAIPFPAARTAAAWKAWPIFACAAALVAVAMLGAFYINGARHSGEAFAHVLRSAGAEFSDGFEATEGVALRDQTFQLTKGSVELTTARGATVVLEAPAEFRFENPQRLRLARGKAAAEAPPSAKGFTVVTPSGEVVDLGTKFGVDVATSGSSEVHVFKGEVVATAGAASKRQSLKQDQALALDDGAAVPCALRTAAFIHADELQELAAGLRGGGQARWRESIRALRRDPALLAFLDFDAVKNGEFRWAQGRWPGTRAAEFTQPGDFLPVDFSGSTNELTLAAWVRLDQAPHAINSLLHTNDWGQPGQVHWMVAEDQRMRLAVFDVRCVDQSRNRYPESSRMVTAATGRWTHLATVYDASRRIARFYIDGEFDNEVPLLAAVPAVLGPGRVGNWNHKERILSGRLDELVMLKRALSDAEIRALFEAGNPYAVR
jgi:Concanavalin A-like lectin/glucanases superfamily/FecR protein